MNYIRRNYCPAGIGYLNIAEGQPVTYFEYSRDDAEAYLFLLNDRDDGESAFDYGKRLKDIAQIDFPDKSMTGRPLVREKNWHCAFDVIFSHYEQALIESVIWLGVEGFITVSGVTLTEMAHGMGLDRAGVEQCRSAFIAWFNLFAKSDFFREKVERIKKRYIEEERIAGREPIEVAGTEEEAAAKVAENAAARAAQKDRIQRRYAAGLAAHAAISSASKPD